MNVINKIIGMFLKPKSGRYIDPVLVTPDKLKSGVLPIQDISLIKQPISDDSIGVNIVFRLPENCSGHHALFYMQNDKNEETTRIWLKENDIVHKGLIYMIHTFDVSLLARGSILVRFEERLWPTCIYYQYSIPLNEYEIT